MKTKNDTINAIQTMVDSAVSKAGYDKTRNAMVIARNSNNTYEIEMDSIRYDNVMFYGSGILQNNEIVKVVIPNNQPSQMYILGKGVVENRWQGSINGMYSNAFGRGTIASGFGAHAEGEYTHATGETAHAEGALTRARGDWSHAEGYSTRTAEDARYSHAEGFNTNATGIGCHAEGEGTTATGMYQHVEGHWNHPDEYKIHIVGNGYDGYESNAYALDGDGNGFFMGDVYVGCDRFSANGEKLIPNNFLEVYGSNGAATTRTLSTVTTFYSPHTQGNWNYRSKNGVGTHPSWASLKYPNPSDGTGIVVIQEAGWYKIDYEAYFFTGFTAGDRVAAGILKNYNIPEGNVGSSNERIVYGRVQNADAYHTLSNSCMVNCARNDELRLAGQNITAGRGTISMSQVSKMIITKI